MPTIYDNMGAGQMLVDALRGIIEEAVASDFCVGYFNLRGWAQLANSVEHFRGTDGFCCRVLVGMHRPPEEEMREAQRAIRRNQELDMPTAIRLGRAASESFKEQLEFGVPTNQAEATLRLLARQIRAGKVRVKLFLRYPLHAKLYLVRRPDIITPLVGYLGSSNLTFAGLSGRGELNVDVVDQDPAGKLQDWFNERWADPFTLDISEELAHLIETSWAREQLVAPYHVYLKMAYHLCEEARLGEREFRLPRELQGVLLDFQEKAVALAARHLHRRGGVLLGDVVGLGKTLTAVAVAAILQQDEQSNALIICPPALQEMWKWHAQRYGLAATVMSLGSVIEALPNLPRHRLVIVDESHNLRTRGGRRYNAIRAWIERNEPRVMLLTATPYNKQFTDLSNQLRLFLDEDQDLHMRPERFFQHWHRQGHTEADFIARYQASPRSLRAFERSVFADDWRDLMRLFLVRRTRRFIIRNYAKWDADKQRHYVMLGGTPFHFPVRQPRTLHFALDDDNPEDQYARLYAGPVADVIAGLALPRYGLAQYLRENAERTASAEERAILENLNRGGRRLIGFCRTNLFKRLESSGHSFLLSLDRHILRNMITVHALENGLPIPIGTQDAAMLDTAVADADDPGVAEDAGDPGTPGPDEGSTPAVSAVRDLGSYRQRAAQVYGTYQTAFEGRFQWISSRAFKPGLKDALLADAKALLAVLQGAGEWRPDRDAKLDELHRLLTSKHRGAKVLVFTQFADTALYLGEHLAARGVAGLEVVTSATPDPVGVARRFSPMSNGGLRDGERAVNVLVATDVLAEGQNLQDSHLIVNYDLPWAIIRLIQRAGRVDRIGQKEDTIFVYSFMPAEGVNEIIRLRERLFQRLRENGEVIGTDESFFGEDAAEKLRDLYTEKAGVLDDDEDEDVDLASIALQVWNSAAEADRKVAEGLPAVISATRPLPEPADGVPPPPGAITYLRFPDGTDALVQVDASGELVSQSLVAAFRNAACAPDTPALPRAVNHHDLVACATKLVMREQATLGGQLGSLRSTRRKLYERLQGYRQRLRDRPTLFSADALGQLDTVLQALFRFPMTEQARDSIGRQIRLGAQDDALLETAFTLYEEGRLCVVGEETEQPEPKVICSLGLAPKPVEGQA